jgi:phospholipid/cholesterol/gamma-HCH transport system substrate-binding protein
MHYSHRLSQTRLHQIVGWFVLVPILVLVGVLVLVAQSENLFEEKYHITTVFSEGYGLKPGKQVMLLGIQIGSVTKVEVTEQNDAKVTMEILKKYRDKIRQNSVAKIGKSGGLVGEPQIEITVGHRSRPVVADGGHIESEEPFNIAEVFAEVKPLVETIKETLARVEEISEDVQATVQTGHEALSHVREASTRLPAILQNVKETTAAVREATLSTAEQLPAIAASVRTSVDLAGAAVRDVKAATSKLPGVVDSVQSAMDNVKAVTEDMTPLLRSVEGTLEDVNEIVTGAKQTFPISTFAAKGRAARAEERIAPVPRSLRRDDLVRE